MRLLSIQLLGVLAILLSSCASIMNSPIQRVMLHTQHAGKIVYGRDTIKAYAEGVSALKVPRKPDSLHICWITDSASYELSSAPHRSAWLLGNVISYGLTAYADSKNDKSWEQPQSLYIYNNRLNELPYWRTKGNIEFFAALEIFNIGAITIPPSTELSYDVYQLISLRVGTEYYLASNQYLSVAVGFPAVLSNEYSVDFQNYQSSNLSLSYTYQLPKRLSFGAGLLFARHSYEFFKENTHTSDSYKVFSYGGVLHANYRVNPAVEYSFLYQFTGGGARSRVFVQQLIIRPFHYL